MINFLPTFTGISTRGPPEASCPPPPATYPSPTSAGVSTRSSRTSGAPTPPPFPASAAFIGFPGHGCGAPRLRRLRAAAQSPSPGSRGTLSGKTRTERSSSGKRTTFSAALRVPRRRPRRRRLRRASPPAASAHCSCRGARPTLTPPPGRRCRSGGD